MAQHNKKIYNGRIKIWQKLLIGMIFGILLGHFFPEVGATLKPLGTLYMNMIKMVVVPLVYFSVINGISSVSDVQTFRRLGMRAITIYAISTTIAITIGLVFANVFKPGIGLDYEMFSAVDKADTALSKGAENNTGAAGIIIDLLVNLVPSNFFVSVYNGNIVQVVFFAMFTGFALLCIGDKGNVIKEFISSATALVFKMVAIVISLAPYGVFGLMASIIGSKGFGILFGLAKFIGVVFSGFFAQYLVSGLLIFTIAKLKPWSFYRKMTNVYALAIATSSSKATLSTAIDELNTKMGVSHKSASFILPLGAAVNMDATAIYLSVSAVFFAQICGVHLALSQYILIVFTTTIGIIGAAGVPSGGVMMLISVLTAIGLPSEGVVIILGIDRLIDMFRTMININSDCAATIIVDKLEGTLDRKKYYSRIAS